MGSGLKVLKSYRGYYNNNAFMNADVNYRNTVIN